MSEHETRGPKPGPRNCHYLGVVVCENGAIAAEMYDPRSADNAYMALGEIGLLKNLETQRAHSLMMPDDMRERSAQSANIMHFALAEVQAEKMRRGIILETPLMLHDDVEVPNPDESTLEIPGGPG